jgi:hypothetical protein
MVMRCPESARDPSYRIFPTTKISNEEDDRDEDVSYGGKTTPPIDYSY